MMGHPLEDLIADPKTAGLFLDFDGVLADIATRPDGAVPRPAIPAILVALNEHLGRLAVVSGRPVSYLDPLIPAPVDIFGLYGLESRRGGIFDTVPEAEQWRPSIEELAAEAIERFGSPSVEPKGLSLTIHYRRNPTLAEPMGDWAAGVAQRTGLESRPAKLSFELHPPIERDKGTVVVEAGRDLNCAVFIGDDLGDLPAFDGLDRLAHAGVHVTRVAVSSVEVPLALLARADHVVDGPAGAEELLGQLVEFLGSARR